MDMIVYEISAAGKYNEHGEYGVNISHKSRRVKLR